MQSSLATFQCPREEEVISGHFWIPHCYILSHKFPIRFKFSNREDHGRASTCFVWTNFLSAFLKLPHNYHVDSITLRIIFSSTCGKIMCSKISTYTSLVMILFIWKIELIPYNKKQLHNIKLQALPLKVFLVYFRQCTRHWVCSGNCFQSISNKFIFCSSLSP